MAIAWLCCLLASSFDCKCPGQCACGLELCHFSCSPESTVSYIENFLHQRVLGVASASHYKVMAVLLYIHCASNAEM